MLAHFDFRDDLKLVANHLFFHVYLLFLRLLCWFFVQSLLRFYLLCSTYRFLARLALLAAAKLDLFSDDL